MFLNRSNPDMGFASARTRSRHLKPDRGANAFFRSRNATAGSLATRVAWVEIQAVVTIDDRSLEQFQEKCVAAFRPELPGKQFLYHQFYQAESFHESVVDRELADQVVHFLAHGRLDCGVAGLAIGSQPIDHAHRQASDLTEFFREQAACGAGRAA